MKKLALSLALLTLAFSAFAVSAHAAAAISVTPASYDFGTVPVNALANTTVTVTNTGDATLNVTSVSTAAPFVVSGTTFSLAPGKSRKLMVGFAPTAPIHYAGSLTITSNASNAPTVNVALSGWGQ